MLNSSLDDLVYKLVKTLLEMCIAGELLKENLGQMVFAVIWYLLLGIWYLVP